VWDCVQYSRSSIPVPVFPFQYSRSSIPVPVFPFQAERGALTRAKGQLMSDVDVQLECKGTGQKFWQPTFE
jgi:hypothetical protein